MGRFILQLIPMNCIVNGILCLRILQVKHQQQDHAARRIQQRYRDYKRIRELNRAVLFIQQMYR